MPQVRVSTRRPYINPVFTPLLTGLGIGLAMVAPAAVPAGKPASEQMCQLMSQVSEQALRLKVDALNIESTETHPKFNVNRKAQFLQLRQHIDQAKLQRNILGEQRDSGAPWQTATVDRIRPLLKELIDDSETLLHLTEDPVTQAAAHKDYLATNAAMSSCLASLIAGFVQYGSTRQELRRLSKEVEP